MSKAAASLALASGNFSTERAPQKPRTPEDELSPSPGLWSPLWQQTSYVFPTKNATSENAIIPVDRTAHILVQPEVDQGLAANNERLPDSANREDGGTGPVQIVNEPDVDVASPLLDDPQSQHLPSVQGEPKAPGTTKPSDVPSETSQEGPKAAEKQSFTVQNGVSGTGAPRAAEPKAQLKALGTATSANPSSSSNLNAKPPATIPSKPVTNKPTVNPAPQTKSYPPTAVR
ncbi:hypothetical protein FRC06_009241 [Ceratobasidium sp. 370]|nr:hypothetical protein FRC06_009241 [Ceratobasidium sp. 370]